MSYEGCVLSGLPAGVLDCRGDTGLLRSGVVSLLCPGRISPLAVLPALDWAAEMAGGDVVVAGGWSSAFEKNLLGYFLRGRAPVVVALARTVYSRLPDEWEAAVAAGRMAVVSLSNNPRQARAAAAMRDRWLASVAEEIVMPCKPREESSLYPIYQDIITSRQPLRLLYQRT